MLLSLFNEIYMHFLGCILILFLFVNQTSFQVLSVDWYNKSLKPSKLQNSKHRCPFVSIASFKMSWSWEFLLHSIQLCPFHLLCLDSFEQKMTFHAPNAATLLSTWGNDWNIERRVSEANILGHPRETFNFLCNFSKAARKFQLGPFTLMFKRKIIVEF